MACSPIDLAEELQFNRGLSDCKVLVFSTNLTILPTQFKYNMKMNKSETFEIEC